MKKFLFLLVTLVLTFMLMVAVNAETKSGYTVNGDGKQTNIKYTLDDSGTLTFEIDSSATGKVASTVLSNKDPITLATSAWDKPLATFVGAKKVIIGEGITEITGTFAASSVKIVEIPTSLSKIGSNAFMLASSLESVYIRGNTPQTGVADISCITTIDIGAFVGMTGIKTVKLEKLKGTIPYDSIRAMGISSIEIPEGVEKLANSCFSKNQSLKTVKILGMNTVIESTAVFKECPELPTIVAKKGSKAESFAKANGMNFVDISTYVEPEEKTESDTPVVVDPNAKKSGYTVDANGKQTNIKYTFDDNGTLTFEIDSSATGKVASTVLSNKDPITLTTSAWDKPLTTFSKAKKVIIGEGITEITGTFAASSVRVVEIPTTLTKIGSNAFMLAKNLECVYVKGTTPKLGVADLRNITAIELGAFAGMTGINTVKLEKLKGTIPYDSIRAMGITSLEIPEGVEKLANSCFSKNQSLKTVKILGMNTEFESVAVFKDCPELPTIVAKKGSKAESFAKANGLTFVDIATYVEPEQPEAPDLPVETEPVETKPAQTTPTEPDVVVPSDYTESPQTEKSGYTLTKDGKQTNIKWSISEDGKTLTFEIDKKAKGKVVTTEIYGLDPITKTTGAWDKSLPTWEKATTAIIGDGITKISGLFTSSKVQTVEIPKSLTALGNSAFLFATDLSSVYIRGTEPQKGVVDLSLVTTLGNHLFVSNSNLKTIKLNPNLTGSLNTEFINKASVTELEIPAGIKTLSASSLKQTNNLRVLTILGMDTAFASLEVFASNTGYPSIKAKAGSKAEQFAKANGFTFIDLDTGEETKGTLPEPIIVVPVWGPEAFEETNYTAMGYITGKVYNTYWVYYGDTKTLKFISNVTSGWNETGRFEFCEDGMGWIDYKEEIEYIEVGPYISCVTTSAFVNHTALKEVKLWNWTTQISGNAFSGCTSLTTIWKPANEKVEGRCDLTNFTKVNTDFSDTLIREVILSPNATIESSLGFRVRNIYSTEINDTLIQYAKDFGYRLINLNDENEVYDYYIEVPDDIIMCGKRCGYTFDEATGTLTIYGSGAIDGLTNYYGGGSKFSPWFEIKQQIKHVVITKNITSIGKYAFTQCENLETVQIPSNELFDIQNAAFEKCTNLKSVYREGTDPIEGTLDLSNVPGLKAWTFAYDYLIANVILSDQTVNVSPSLFEENTNLANIYGVPGSYAETYAAENGLAFYDIATNVPEAIKCTIPETTASSTDVADDTSDVFVTEEETTHPLFNYGGEEDTSATTKPIENNGNMGMIIVIVIVAVVIIAGVALVVVVKRKKR